MIRLNKGQPPQVLVDNAEAWADEYRDLRERGRGSTFRRHRHHEVKAAVLAETSEKCAFCESKMRHVSYGDVEHILPKSQRPDLVVEWTNLTLACSICNGSKGDYYSEEAPLVHPYEDDPQDHLIFLGPMVIHVRGDPCGERTTRRLDLNRVELLERRADRLTDVKGLVDRIDALPPGPDRDLFTEEVRREAEPDGEYAAAVRDFIAAHVDSPPPPDL